ncbi:Uracil DNA glycosylase superfamily protein [compost metagenome]
MEASDEPVLQAEWPSQEPFRRQRRDELRWIAEACAADLDCPGATQVVPGEGNPQAAIVLVGEAPGEQEDRDGRPFVGRAGQLLDRILEQAELKREDVWITNAVKCRPVLFEGDRMRNRPPKVSEVRAWSACLHEELKRIGPQVLVGLGAVAGRALLGPDFKLTQERGVWHRDVILGTETLVTWHPAYLLRQKGEVYERRLEEAIADLRSAAMRLRSLSSP